MIIRVFAIFVLVCSSAFAQAKKVKRINSNTYSVPIENTSDPEIAKPKKPQPAPQPRGTVVKPPALPKDAFLLKGDPGSGQSKDYYAFRYFVRDNGTIVKYSAESGVACELEKPCTLLPGHYLVRYSSTYMFVEIVDGQPTVVSRLEYISVPKATGKYQYRLFNDLSDTDMQNVFLQYQIMAPGKDEESKIEGYPAESWGAQVLRKFMDGGDARAASPDLRSAYFTEGKRCAVLADKERPVSSCYYNYVDDDPAEGTFIAVMPGKYGIEWKAPNGQKIYQFGIPSAPKN